MKIRLVIIVLCLLWSGNVYSDSMISIKKYIQENNNYASDPVTLAYVLKRCSSAYLYAASITKDKDPNTADKLALVSIKISCTDS